MLQRTGVPIINKKIRLGGNVSCLKTEEIKNKLWFGSRDPQNPTREDRKGEKIRI